MRTIKNPSQMFVVTKPRSTNVYNKKTKVYRCIHSEDRGLQMHTFRRPRSTDVHNKKDRGSKKCSVKGPQSTL